MNIGFDAKRAFQNETGLGNYSRTLITNLLKFFPNNQYHLFAPKKKIEFLKENNKPHIHQPQNFFQKKLSWYWRSIAVNKEILKNSLDIFHGLSAELPFGIIGPKTKKVLTVHDLIFLKYPQYYPLIDRKIYEFKIRCSCEQAHLITAISEQTKMDLIDWLPQTKEKISVVYQSCDEIFWQKQPLDPWAFSKKVDLPEQFLLYVGAISERKNLSNLIKAYKEIATNTAAHLVLIGNGKKYKDKLEQVILDLDLADRIHLLSNIPNEDLPHIYRRAEVFVYPSVYEGFGIPIIEAMCCEVPVVTTKGGCFHEAGGQAALYVNSSNHQELAEGMLKVLNDESLRKKMIEEGKNHVQNFSAEKTSHEIMHLYHELLKQ